VGFTVMQHHYGESSFFGKSSHIFSRDGQFSSIFHSYVSYICEIAGGSIFVDTPAKISRATFRTYWSKPAPDAWELHFRA